VAVASAGPYASLQLDPDRQPYASTPPQFFTDQMLFLPPNQQRQSTEGNQGSHIKMTILQQVSQFSARDGQPFDGLFSGQSW